MNCLAVLWIALLYLSTTTAVCNTNAHMAVAIDSTKMTNASIFNTQKLIVQKLLDLTKVKYALMVYTGDKAWVYKDFGQDTSLNGASLVNLTLSTSNRYGFDPKQLFSVKYNRRPDCLWLLRNNFNETYPNINGSLVNPMGYGVKIPKIYFTFGEGGSANTQLKKLTYYEDFHFFDKDIKKALSSNVYVGYIKDSICEFCKELFLTTPSVPVTTTGSTTNQETTPEMTKTTPEGTHTTPTNNNVPKTGSWPPTTVDMSPGDMLKKDYKMLLTYNISQMNLTNEQEIRSFVGTSTRLLMRSHLLTGNDRFTNMSVGFQVLDILENFCVSVGRAMTSNNTLEIQSNKIFLGISAVNVTSFRGFTSNYWSASGGFVRLPPAIFKDHRGLGVLVVMVMDPIQQFLEGRALHRDTNVTLAGKIVNVITEPRPTQPLDPPVIIGIKHSKATEDKNEASCVFWDVRQRGWSTAGCSVTTSNASVTECQCNHMTHYAVLLSLNEQVIPKNHYQAMTIISYIGCSLSIVGVFLTIITFLCLPVLKSERTRIHCNLCIAIGLSQILFLAAGTKELVDNTVACKLYAAFMFYFFMSVFTWMFVEGIHLYQMVIIAFVNRSMMRFYYALGWGLPAVIVTIASAIAHKGYGTSQFCWISLKGGTIYAFAVPAGIVILINMVILCCVLRLRVKLDKSSDVHKTVKTGARVSVVLLPLLGMTWVFGFFSVLPNLGVVFQYLFAITNSMQGFMVFVFHCIGNSEVRREFHRKAEHFYLTRNLSSNTMTMVSNKVTPSDNDLDTATINK